MLDIGCAEGYFSFEAERRGAREVIGIDSFPDSVRRFNVTKAARQSNATAFLMNVYDLDPKRLGTFDLVLFYGVFYHLKHPQYALERIRSVCTGEMLFQTHIYEEPAVRGTPWARFHPHGMMSGQAEGTVRPHGLLALQQRLLPGDARPRRLHRRQGGVRRPGAVRRALPRAAAGARRPAERGRGAVVLSPASARHFTMQTRALVTACARPARTQAPTEERPECQQAAN